MALILEDLHWGDIPSAKFVEHALRILRDRPLFQELHAQRAVARYRNADGDYVYKPGTACGVYAVPDVTIAATVAKAASATATMIRRRSIRLA